MNQEERRVFEAIVAEYLRVCRIFLVTPAKHAAYVEAEELLKQEASE